MSDHLANLLRSAADEIDAQDNLLVWSSDLREAADRIEEVAAERDRLAESLETESHNAEVIRQGLLDRISEVTAERDRLAGILDGSDHV